MTSTNASESLRRLARVDPLHAEAHEWLDLEAEILDQYRLEDWLQQLDPELRYRVPIRQTLYRKDGPGFASTPGHFDETYNSIEFRVKRLIKASSWSEDPASRTRRFVTNVRVYADKSSLLRVDSYLLLLRNRGDAASFDVISCQRSDTLRRHAAGGLRLLARHVQLDQSVLGTPNLSVFL